MNTFFEYLLMSVPLVLIIKGVELFRRFEVLNARVTRLEAEVHSLSGQVAAHVYFHDDVVEN